jgi:hypothetical protein
MSVKKAKITVSSLKYKFIFTKDKNLNFVIGEGAVIYNLATPIRS